MGRWQAWCVMGVVWAVGCSSSPADPVDADADSPGLEARCEAAGGDFYEQVPATLCIFGERQGTPVGPGFACPEGFPNRLGDEALLFCNASDVFPTEMLVELDARYPACTDCVEDAGDAGSDAPLQDVGEPGELESCAQPGDLVWVDGQAEVEGSFVGTAAGEALSCDANATVGHVYALTTDVPGDLVVEVEADEGTFVPSLALRTVCGQRASVLPGACVDHRARPAKNVAVLLSAEPATYYVWVATPAAERGAYRLRASFMAREGAQALETCEVLPEVALGDGERLGLGVSARGQFEVAGPLCEHSATSRAEVGVDVEVDGFLTIDLLREAGQGFAARLRETCGNAAGEVCGDIIVGERRRNLLRREVEAGSKTLSLGNLPDSAIPGYALELRHSSELAGQRCARPQVLDVSARDEEGVFEGVIAASLLGYEDNAAAECGVNGRDRVWELVLTEPSDVRVEARSLSGAALSVTLTSSCDAPGYCSVEGVARSGLAAGTYYVRVDGDLDDPAEFELDVRVRPALEGGSCEVPGDAVVLGIGDSAPVTLRQADGPSGMIRCEAEVSRDRVVPLELAEAGDLAIDAAGEVLLEELVIEHAPSCETAGSCGGAIQGIAALEAGNQVLRLGSRSGADEEDIEVMLELLRQGERCFGAQVVPLNDDYEVSLIGYQPDAAPGCVSGELDADRAYAFELSQTSTVIVTLTPADVQQAVALWLERGACGEAQELGCEHGEAGQPATLVLGALQPGIYRVWVGGDPGDSTLHISTN
ncbi:hypothetical protein FRC96_06045 [Lujinxingia vulgaris]|uniref:Uncharacterized protein n=1 Tax=Lujinxingia vulgaris TaxID=2600176 RepID=A0A5C6XIM0_9DELT|nr:hypothetical protein [Lujinxingia vulgaris]TXD39830.1 hypothetical protein FRC96_06045 [Lujinxingia vulgaris]